MTWILSSILSHGSPRLRSRHKLPCVCWTTGTGADFPWAVVTTMSSKLAICVDIMSSLQPYQPVKNTALAPQPPSPARSRSSSLTYGLACWLVSLLAFLTSREVPPRDIRLGDVLVGLPTGESAGLIAYDLGKETGKTDFNCYASDMCWPIRKPLLGQRSVASSSWRRMMQRRLLPYYEGIKHKKAY